MIKELCFKIKWPQKRGRAFEKDCTDWTHLWDHYSKMRLFLWFFFVCYKKEVKWRRHHSFKFLLLQQNYFIHFLQFNQKSMKKKMLKNKKKKEREREREETMETICVIFLTSLTNHDMSSVVNWTFWFMFTRIVFAQTSAEHYSSNVLS